jgi:hypothetical protein
MTPNGAILFGIAAVVATMTAGDVAGLATALALTVAFATIEVGSRAMTALTWPAAIVAPLAAFMALVWVGLVGRSPGEIAAGVPGTRTAALAYVAMISTRLFLVALMIQLVVLRFAHTTPLRFVRALRAPIVLKKLLVLTLSWIDTMLHAVDRSRTALITAGIIAPRVSAKNLTNGWILVQTVWLSVITIAIGRLRDKWPAENTIARLDEALHAPPQSLTARDLAWAAAALAALVAGRIV